MEATRILEVDICYPKMEEKKSTGSSRNLIFLEKVAGIPSLKTSEYTPWNVDRTGRWFISFWVFQPMFQGGCSLVGCHGNCKIHPGRWMAGTYKITHLERKMIWTKPPWLSGWWFQILVVCIVCSPRTLMKMNQPILTRTYFFTWVGEKPPTIIGKLLVPLGPYLFNPPKSPSKGDIPYKYPLYKVYMGLVIKGTIPRVPPFSQWG